MTPRTTGKGALGYGQGKATIHLNEVRGEEITAAILERFHAPDYAPPVAPSTALELHALSRMPSVEYRDVSKLLTTDPLLAARVLRVAQSPAYAGRAAITSLKDAALRLGLSTLSDIFLQTALSARVFRAKGFEKPMEQLLVHSLAVARAARALATRAGLSPDHAFLCGLLHEIGYAAGLLVVAEEQAKGHLPTLPMDEITSAVSRVHAEASGLIARLWKLPSPVAAALEHHHRPFVGTDLFPDGALLVVAESAVPAAAVIEPAAEPEVVARAALSLGVGAAAIVEIRTRLALA